MTGGKKRKMSGELGNWLPSLWGNYWIQDTINERLECGDQRGGGGVWISRNASVALQNRIPAGVADSLIVPVGASQGTLIGHPALFHHHSGMWISGIVTAFDTIRIDPVEKEVNQSGQRF